MSIFSFKAPEYAETHFKFKLPWSLLYRPWPEIFVDAPFQFVKGSIPKLFLVVRDADRFPVTVKKIFITLKNETEESSLNFDINFTPKKNLEFYPIELGILKPGNYKVQTKILVQKGSKEKIISRWNYPWLAPCSIQFQVLKEDLPKAPGYFAGEMHCHTKYSADHVEFGASPEVFQEAAKAVGLDFVCCTDHAYDFAFQEKDYTKETEPTTRFESLKAEIKKLPTYPLLLAGEEVSVGNSQNENVHMTVFAPEKYLPGLGDCGRYWLKNEPTYPIKKILQQTTAPCFAAHPKAPMNSLEKFIFRRGYWSSKDLYHQEKKIRGIQFWNGSRDEGFEDGKKWWIEELGKGNFLLPIGGNDAHGDLNDTVSVKMPLISLRRDKNHVFGKVRTVFCANNLSEEALKEGLQGYFLYVTDGPALWWEIRENKCHLFAKSNNELGMFKAIRIFTREILPNGKFSTKEYLHSESRVLAPIENEIVIDVERFAYVRAEAVTAKERFALTSAIPLV